MKTSSVPEMPKPTKKAKAPREKKAASHTAGTISLHSYMDDGIMAVVNKEMWYLKLNGELLIFGKKEHTFKCSWQMTGTIWACLYTSMPTEEAYLKKLLSIRAVQEFLIKNSKRKVPKDWITSQPSTCQTSCEDSLQSPQGPRF